MNIIRKLVDNTEIQLSHIHILPRVNMVKVMMLQVGDDILKAEPRLIHKECYDKFLVGEKIIMTFE